MEEEMYILIAKSLNRETSAEEERLLAAWLERDAANRDIYERMKAAWEQADTLFDQPVFDTTAAWEKVALQTTGKAPERQTSTFKKWWAVTAAAAALILVILAIKTLMQPEWETITATGDMAFVELPDHSKVRLEAGSTLKYPKTFAADRRKVSLEGRAFFDIKHKEDQPFTVDARSVDVNVLGTSFYVTSGDEQASVTVTTGKVAMVSRDGSGKIVLTPGSKGIFKDHHFNVTTDTNTVFYQQGLLEFKSTPLVNALSVIANVTNSNISIDPGVSPAIREQLIDISFQSRPVENMLDEICLITNTHWKKDKELYLVYAR